MEKLKFIVLLNVHATWLFGFIELHVMDVISLERKSSTVRGKIYRNISDGSLWRSY